MKAAVFHGPGQLEVEERPVPDIGPDDVLLEVEACGICGTDQHILHGAYTARVPCVLGHEFAGLVRDRGARVRNVEVGDRVTIEPHRFCGVCKFCRVGKEHLCLTKLAYGVHLDGGLADYCAVPARTAYRLPFSMPARIGCLTEPLACCVHGIDRLHLRAGQSLVIIGAGPIGLLMTQLSRLQGASPVAVVEPNHARRDTALMMGADHALDPTSTAFTEHVHELTEGLGFDAIIEAVGRPETFELALDLAARGSTILVFGVAPPDLTVPVRPNAIYAKELTLVGSVINPYTHHRAVELLPRLDFSHFTIKTFPLDDVAAALDAQRSGEAIKIEIAPAALRSHRAGAVGTEGR
jgi:L-iditol 2-dehydrogenase